MQNGRGNNDISQQAKGDPRASYPRVTNYRLNSPTQASARSISTRLRIAA